MADVDRAFLLDRALTCFTDRGLQGASTAYLVQATGLPKGTLYRTIHSKAYPARRRLRSRPGAAAGAAGPQWRAH
jgi:AcrR family transcriptional regulator